MSDQNFPLRGETVVFTGSKKPVEAMERVGELGGNAVYLPLIKTVVRQSELPDFDAYDWLIFTSRNSAEAFCLLDVPVKRKIAAVGEKTAEVLRENGYQVDFMPSVYSADRFVEEFPEQAGQDRCLFIKGSLAKNTIASMPIPVDEWVIYETTLNIGNAKKLAAMKNAAVLFASPSAVSAYREAGGDWQGIKVAAIGHVTRDAILKTGGQVDFIPEKYTILDALNEIVKGSCFNE
ncbi:uroporphyrinogen-III synthase [Planomicrobium sp. CPCC 101079]|uniref:uroporphyrinogen-III synthase n=1 Tax=Planomicrobium sp. CPCC 101079 TaxID=2599618 RepID=UPI0011B3A928|nr:uroporphyrinogen-III synthase [Planomicrobium sp. CPCC 101079]TWT08997.1 uroporphyrinogen-III synthase [Planomicrobium sp. CPCC 101079]